MDKCLFSLKNISQKEEKIKLITQLREKYPLKLLLEISEIPKSVYYYHLLTIKNKDIIEFTIQIKEDMGIENNIRIKKSRFKYQPQKSI